MAHPSISSLVLDDVRLTGRELGRGAYGVVYEVSVSELVCAGKILHDNIVQDSTANKFVEECLCHSQQRHPNIVQLIGIHYPQGSRLPMLVMEYLPMSLTQYIETHQDLPLCMKYSILLDTAKGLNYLHQRRPPIIHRDLTANNVLLTSSLTAKISDLGVSRMAETFKQYQFTKAPGNAIVMPPEALTDTPQYDQKLDVFSYGCLILFVLTHQWPEPTAQYVQSSIEISQRRTFELVSEWDRRSKYTSLIASDHPLLVFTKSCLHNDPIKRPSMSNAIQYVQYILNSLPPLRSALELTRENEILHRQLEEEKKVANEEIMKAKATEQEKNSLVIQLMDKVQQVESDNQRLRNDINEIWQAKVKVEKEFAQKSQLLQQENSRADSLAEQVAELSLIRDGKRSIDRRQMELEEKIMKQEIELKQKTDLIQLLLAQCKNTPPSSQYNLVNQYFEKNLILGEEWYLIGSKWFLAWKHYVTKIEKTPPGPRDNSGLFLENKLKPNLKKNDDYILLYKPIWDLLVNWYGLSVGSVPTMRHVIEWNGELMVEVDLLELKLCVYEDTSVIKITSFSKKDTIYNVIQKIRELFHISSTAECRLWMDDDGNYHMLNNTDITLHDVGVESEQMLVIEVKSVWPRKFELTCFRYFDIERNFFHFADTLDCVKQKMMINRNIPETNECVFVHVSLDERNEILNNQDSVYNITTENLGLLLVVSNPDGSMVTAISVKLCIYPHTGNLKSDEFNITDTIDTVVRRMKKLFNIFTTTECRLWINNKMLKEYEFYKTLLNVRFTNDQTLVLEIRNADGNWPRTIKLNLCIYPHMDNLKQSSFYMEDTIGTVVQEMKQLFNVSATAECRLWMSDKLINDRGMSIFDANISSDEKLMLDVRKHDGRWQKLFSLKLCLYGCLDDIKQYTFDPLNTIATVIQKMGELFNISATATECRLWMNDKVLNEFHKSLLDEEITDGETLICEVRNNNHSDSWRKIELKLSIYPHTDNIALHIFDPVDNTLVHVKDAIRLLYKVSATDECRLWKKSENGKYSILENLKQKICKAGLNGNEVLILEVKDSRTDSWPWRVPLTVFIAMGKIFSLDPIDDTVGTIVEKMRELYKIPTTDECRLLTNIGSDVAGIVLNDFSKSIYDIRKTHTKTDLILQTKNPDGDWPAFVKFNMCLYPHIDKIEQCSLGLDAIEDFDHVLEQLFANLHVPLPDSEDDGLLWIKPLGNYWFLFEDIDFKNEFPLFIHSTLMLEIRNVDGSWPWKIELNLCIYPHINNVKQYSFHMRATIGVIVEKMIEIFSVLVTGECRLWKYDNYGFYGLLDDVDAEVYSLQLDKYSAMPLLVLEVQSEDGTWIMMQDGCRHYHIC